MKLKALALILMVSGMAKSWPESANMFFRLHVAYKYNDFRGSDDILKHNTELLFYDRQKELMWQIA